MFNDLNCFLRWMMWPMGLLFLFNMIGLLIDMQNDPFWLEVDVESLILWWPLRPVGLLCYLLVLYSVYLTKKFIIELLKVICLVLVFWCNTAYFCFPTLFQLGLFHLNIWGTCGRLCKKKFYWWLLVVRN